MTVYDEEAIEMLKYGLMNSEWHLTGGGDSNYYLDLDTMLSKPNRIEIIASKYLSKIDYIQSLIGPIDRLAFIEKDSGPIGALSLKDLLVVRSGIPGLIVRLQRRVLWAAIKGYAMSEKERILIVSDVSTSGSAILKAARIIWAFNAVVPAALVYFDRDQGATENLINVDIKLFSIVNQPEVPQLTKYHDLSSEALLLSSSSISSILP